MFGIDTKRLTAFFLNYHRFYYYYYYYLVWRVSVNKENYYMFSFSDTVKECLEYSREFVRFAHFELIESNSIKDGAVEHSRLSCSLQANLHLIRAYLIIIHYVLVHIIAYIRAYMQQKNSSFGT